MGWTKEIKDELHKDRLLFWVSVLTAAFFSCALVFGEALQTEGELPIRHMDAWIAVVLTGLVIWIGLVLFLYVMKTGVLKSDASLHSGEKVPAEEKKENAASRQVRKEGLLDRILRKPGICFLSFILCWIPSFLAVYPGFFLYDACDEYWQIDTGMYSTHHPLLHVLLLGATVKAIHYLTGSFNYGIGVYLSAQMCVIAACFTCLLVWMRYKGVCSRVRKISFLYLAFFPVNVMFVLCTVKDTLFAAGLLMVLLLMRLLFFSGKQGEERNTFLSGKRGTAVLVAAFVVTLLFRNNMLYATLVYGLFLLVLVWRKSKGKERMQHYKRVVIFFFSVFLLFFGISKGMAIGLHAMKGGAQEMLTVPIQQIARCYHADPGMYSAEEKELLFSYLPEEAIKRYTPNLSDPVKVSFDSDVYRNNAMGFWKLWAKGFLHNPIGYVNAWCMTSYGFWYPDAVIDVYQGHNVFTHNYEKSSYFGFETELPGVRDSKFPLLEKMYYVISLEGTVQRRPVLSWLFSMGFLTFVYVICFDVMAVRRQWNKLLVYLLPALVWMTFLLGPTFLPRYMVFQWFLLPMVMADTFCVEDRS